MCVNPFNTGNIAESDNCFRHNYACSINETIPLDFLDTLNQIFLEIVPDIIVMQWSINDSMDADIIISCVQKIDSFPFHITNIFTFCGKVCET